MYYENGFAIVGIGCRFPGGIESLDSLWEVLSKGTDVVSNVPEDRFSIRRYWHPDRQAPGRTCTTSAGIVGDVKQFDAAFFSMSPKEAEALDPQQRMVLEMAWEAFEDAGIKPSSVARSNAAVYIGAASTDMGMIHSDDLSVTGPYGMTGTSLSIIANRLSYFFDLHGPSMTIDTACSSSLVALHEACRAMTEEKLPMAIVGGVNVLLSPMPFVGFSKAHMLSKDGRCKVFDAEGNGYVRSEGGAVIIIKPLDAAIRDGDAIHAVIRATGVNSDGRTNGIALPNGEAQKRLLQSIYDDPAVDRSRVAYLEAHGTGTAAGDPIETKSIGEVLGHHAEGEEPLLIGSVKSNLGHLETGSGMAGIAKAITVLREHEVPPNILLKHPNPAIDFKGLGLKVPQAMTPLPAVDGAPLVGINSFGFGGTNAHVLLEEGQKPKVADCKAEDANEEAGLLPFMISARSAESLRTMAALYGERLSAKDQSAYNRIASAVAGQRERLSHAAVLMPKTVEAAVKALNTLARTGELPKSSETGAFALEHVSTAVRSGRIGFIYSGNGSQWAGMGAELYAAEPRFRQAIDEIDGFFEPLAGWKIAERFHSPKEEWGIERTEIAQPLIFAVQVGVTKCLRACGIDADAVTGHSVGEVASAWAAGCLTLEDAVRVIFERSSLQGRMMGSGTMAAAKLSEEKLKALLAGYPNVEIAGLNAVDNYTLSGDEAAIDELGPKIKAQGGLFKKLALPYAFHSSRMAPLEADIRSTLADIKPEQGSKAFYSSVKGARLDEVERLDADYWWRNIRRPVLFEGAVSAMMRDGTTQFIEVGPHAILLGYIRATAKSAGKDVFVHGTMARGTDVVAFRQSLAQLMAAVNVKTTSVWPDVPRDRTLPRYPWNKKSFWAEPTAESNHLYDAPMVHPLLGWAVPHADHVWENTIDLALYPWLAGHEIDETVLFPAAGFLETVFAAGRSYLKELGAEGPTAIRNLAILRPLVLDDQSLKCIRTTVAKDGVITMGSREILSKEEYLTHLAGRIVRSDAPRPNRRGALSSICREETRIDTTDFYQTLAKLGLHYEGAFKPIADAWRLPGEKIPAGKTAGQSSGKACVRVVVKLESRLPEADAEMGLPPALVDGALQGLFLALREAAEEGLLGESADLNASYLPSWVGNAAVWDDGVPVWAEVRLLNVSSRSALVEFTLMDEAGNVLAELRDVRFLRVHHKENGIEPAFYFDEWVVADEDRPLLTSDIKTEQTQLEKALQSAADCIGWTAQKADESSVLFYWLCASFARDAAKRTAANSSVRRGNAEEWVPAETFFTNDFVAPEAEPLVSHLIDLLVEAGLAEEEDGLVRLKPFDQDVGEAAIEPDMLFRTVTSEHHSLWPVASTVSLIGKYLTELLTGDKKLEDVLPKRATTVRPLVSRMPQGFILKLALENWVRGIETTAARKGACVRGLYVAPASGSVLSGIRAAMSDRSTLHVVLENAQAVERAKTELAHLPGVTFNTIESLEKDSVEIDQDRFDWAILPDGLAFAENVPQILKGIRTALRPGGLMLLCETKPNEPMNFIEGADPQWWTTVDGHAASRLASAEGWLAAMKSAGFDGVRLGSNESTDSSAEGAVPSVIDPRIFLLCEKPVEVSTTEEVKAESEKSTRPVVLFTDRNVGEIGAAFLTTVKTDVSDATVVNVDAADEAPVDWTANIKSLPANATVVAAFGFDETDKNPASLFDLLKALEAAADTSDMPAGLRFFFAVPAVSGLPNTDDASKGSVGTPAGDAAMGMLRVFRNESRSVSVSVLSIADAKPETIARAASYTKQGLQSKDFARDEAAVRDGLLYTRVVTTKSRRSMQEAIEAEAQGSETHVKTLAFDSPGRIERLYWKREAKALPPLGADEIRVDVRATGLNFRDVMWAMGMLPEDALENGFSGPTMGLEAAGVVTAVGHAVTRFRPGDEVVAFAPACFSSVITTTEAAAAKKPTSLSFAEAASVPVAFFTAWYSLVWLGRAKQGEAVLIHGAAGGVGLAAIQIASLLGLEIYATAGTDAKRTLLRRLGVKHVYNSRSLAFADEIRRDTNGRGVDLVLNSLAGAGAEKSLELLAPLGRFLELGKRDFYADSPMFLRPFRRNISYFGIDADQILVDAPELAGKLFAEVLARFESGDFRPLPFMMFSAENAAEAFQTMQASQQIGKLVVVKTDIDQPTNKAKSQRTSDFSHLCRGGTVVISGGLGGLGRKAALRMADRGAKALVLITRSGVTEASADFVKSLETRGVTVRAPKLDLGAGDESTVRSVLEEALDGIPPLAGVIHAAGVIHDAYIRNLTADDFEKTWQPKVVAAERLLALMKDRAESGMPVNFFAVFSSATVLLGNPGQANYVAANAAMDKVVAEAREAGIPAVLIGWGPVGDVGMLKSNPSAKKMLEMTLGTPALESSDVLDALEAGILSGKPSMSFFAVNWQRIGDLPVARSARFAPIWSSVGTAREEKVSLEDRFAGKSEEEAVSMLTGYVAEEVAALMGVAATELNVNQPVADIGMDSLMVVELAAALEERLGLKIPAVSLSGGATIRTIAERFWQMIAKKNADEQALDVLAEKHGVVMTDEMKTDVLKNIGS